MSRAGGDGGKRRSWICVDGPQQAARDREQGRQGGAPERHRARVDERGSARGRAQGRDGEPPAQAGAVRRRDAGIERRRRADGRSRDERTADDGQRVNAHAPWGILVPAGGLPIRFWIGYNRWFSPSTRCGWYWEVVQR